MRVSRVRGREVARPRGVELGRRQTRRSKGPNRAISRTRGRPKKRASQPFTPYGHRGKKVPPRCVADCLFLFDRSLIRRRDVR